MASEKEKMYSTANNYINKVTVAKNACAAAANNMISPQDVVSRNWSGASGDAMALALEELRFEVNKAYGRLVTLESQMRRQANSIYDNWPKEMPQQVMSKSTKQAPSTSTNNTSSTTNKKNPGKTGGR